MTAEQKLEWVANHLTLFRPLVDSATMEYINNCGEEYSVTYTSDVPNPTNLQLLEGCIKKVIEAC